MSTELAIRTEVTIDPQTANWLERLEAAKDALNQMESITDAENVANIAAAAIAYAHVVRSKEAADYATEVRIWAERRMVEIAMDTGGSLTQVAKEVGIPWSRLVRWKQWATCDPEVLQRVIDSVKKERDLTLGAVSRRLNRELMVKVEPGIYKAPSGQYHIRYRYRGREHLQGTGSTRIEQARHALRVARGEVDDKEPTSGTPDLRACYALVRKALYNAQVGRDTASPRARSLADKAMTALHSAEDLIAQAIKENEMVN